ncbi:MAG TPA: asparagine synthase-related protein [Anaerolineae bacterium]|nr:asparagine synthase-related protein [Anaerolineae bacterium]
MPGIFVVISDRDVSTDVPRMVQRLQHGKAWFESKSFKVAEGYQGIVTFPSELVEAHGVSATGVHILVYGEVYSYGGDNESTAAHGAELVALLYEKYGLRFVDFLNGSFCLTLYDERLKQVLVVTDRFGSKPLYRDMRADGLRVASEIKALLVDANVPLTYNARSVVNLFTFQHPLEHDTFFNELEVLPPASVLVYNTHTRQVTCSTYWNYDVTSEPTELAQRSLPDLVEQYGALMEEAIHQRVAPYPRIGVFISGGIDSRLALAFAKRVADKTNKQIFAFTFGTRNGYQSVPAMRIAQALGVEHFFYAIPDDTLTKHAWEVVWNGDGHIRIRDAHFVSCLTAIREQVDVVLADYMSGLYYGGHITSSMSELTDRRAFADYLYEQKKVDFIHDVAGDVLQKDFVDSVARLARENFDATLEAIPAGIPYRMAHYWDMYHRGRRYVLPITNYPRWYLPCVDASVDNRVTDFAFALPVELLMKKHFLRQVQRMCFPELGKIEFELTPAWEASSVAQFIFRVRRYLARNGYFLIQKYSRGKVLIKNRDYRAYDYWLRTSARDFAQAIVNDAAYFDDFFLSQPALQHVWQEHLACQQDHDQFICDALNLVMLNHYFVKGNIPSHLG